MSHRTYRYFQGKPLYEFGYGLSYSTFEYSQLSLSKSNLAAGDTLDVTASVKNTGALPGDEVVQLYLVPPQDGNAGLSPHLQMEGFQRVTLQPGEEKHVAFHLTPQQLSEVGANGNRSVQPGHYTVSIGGSQPGDRSARTRPVTASFSIQGTTLLPR